MYTLWRLIPPAFIYLCIFRGAARIRGKMIDESGDPFSRASRSITQKFDGELHSPVKSGARINENKRFIWDYLIHISRNLYLRPTDSHTSRYDPLSLIYAQSPIPNSITFICFAGAA